MGEGIKMLRTLLVLIAALVSAQQVSFAQKPDQSHVVPLKTPSKLAMDKRFETIAGDPTKPGESFVIRIHAEAGYVIMPHTHPVDENIVVVKGSWALGMGDRFNRDTLEPMEVGDYGFAAKKDGTLRFVKVLHDRPGAWDWALYHAMGCAGLRAHG